MRARYYTSHADLIFSGLAMATRITTKGQVTLSKKARAALHVAPGDCVEFSIDESGAVIVYKAAPVAVSASLRRERLAHPRVEAQRRLRVAEFEELLRELD
jgi:AbrB family looped-hinge helix DNA binding protein